MNRAAWYTASVLALYAACFFAGVSFERVRAAWTPAPEPAPPATSAAVRTLPPEVVHNLNVGRSALTLASGVVLPSSPDEVSAAAGITDYDLEVCRSVNTTCIGLFDRQARCSRGPTSWTAVLTPGQVNCVIAAQGLLSRDDRAAWIRNCDARINCR